LIRWATRHFTRRDASFDATQCVIWYNFKNTLLSLIEVQTMCSVLTPCPWKGRYSSCGILLTLILMGKSHGVLARKVYTQYTQKWRHSWVRQVGQKWCHLRES
jgi:hypothetical protein